jgi:transcriptional regulator with XRE-family HTH domain
MFNTLGERITYCRNLLGFTRNEMVEIIGSTISLPTLARWELNTVAPSTKKIEALTHFFIKQGINVSAEWIKEGLGFPPVSLDLKNFDPSQFDELAYSTLVSIRNKVKDFCFMQINSNFFRPVLSFGDYIGGIIEGNKKILSGRLCFLSMEGLVVAGVYNYEKNCITNLNGDVKDAGNNTEQMGEIQWIIRRP